MLKSFFLGMMAAAVLSAPAALAQGKGGGDQVVVLGLQIDGLHHTDHKGPYDQVFEKMRPLMSTPFKLDVLPPARVLKMFETCKDCCFSPANQQPEWYDYPAKDYVETLPLNVGHMFVFTKPGTAPVKSLTELKGKRVGTRNGLPYPQNVNDAEKNKDFKVIPVDSIEQNIASVQKDRIDAFIDFIPDVRVPFKNLKMDLFPHYTGGPVAKHADRVVCHRTPKTEKFTKDFDQALEKVSKSGDLVKILGESFNENPFVNLK